VCVCVCVYETWSPKLYHLPMKSAPPSPSFLWDRIIQPQTFPSFPLKPSLPKHCRLIPHNSHAHCWPPEWDCHNVLPDLSSHGLQETPEGKVCIFPWSWGPQPESCPSPSPWGFPLPPLSRRVLKLRLFALQMALRCNCATPLRLWGRLWYSAWQHSSPQFLRLFVTSGPSTHRLTDRAPASCPDIQDALMSTVSLPPERVTTGKPGPQPSPGREGPLGQPRDSPHTPISSRDLRLTAPPASRPGMQLLSCCQAGCQAPCTSYWLIQGSKRRLFFFFRHGLAM
jgi:hypothetical protein